MKKFITNFSSGAFLIRLKGNVLRFFGVILHPEHTALPLEFRKHILQLHQLFIQISCISKSYPHLIKIKGKGIVTAKINAVNGQIVFIDQLMLVLYNSCCKIIVKKWAGEKILRLLIVEDEKQMCDTVARSLYAAGYEVDTCYDGAEALECILAENYDLIVLDLNLPGMDGMDLLKELRKENEETKVLILSARGQIADKVEGLDAGANDYMEKPFHLQELEARIRSLTRRKFVQKDVCLESGGIRFDTIKREAYANGTLVSLTRKENGILEYLLLHLGRPVSQEELIEHVWDASVDSFSGSIRVHMSSLRRKLRAVLGYDPILNKVGEGYQIREESDR